MFIPSKETQDLVLRLGVVVTISLTIYTCLVVVNMNIKQQDQIGMNTKQIGFHKEYIKSKIIKAIELREIAKGESLKLYMETGNKTKMIELGME